MIQSFVFHPSALQTVLEASQYDKWQSELNPGKDICLIDARVAELYPELLELFVPERVLLLEAGEAHKDSASLDMIYEHLFRNNAKRETLIYVIGGGSITDVGAYAVSTFKRGCQLILVPSTLLGMVDAAIGGKTALNYKGFKNLIGSFYPASRVVLLPELLQSLPPEELRQGWAEMFKIHFVIESIPEPIIPTTLIPPAEMIFAFAAAKLNLCLVDLEDHGKRRLLNLGHSFAHALEAVSHGEIMHGDAVIWGMYKAAEFSYAEELIDRDTLQLINKKLDSYPLPRHTRHQIRQYPDSELKAAIKQDKKNQSSMQFILFKAYRKVGVYPLVVDEMVIN